MEVSTLPKSYVKKSVLKPELQRHKKALKP